MTTRGSFLASSAMGMTASCLSKSSSLASFQTAPNRDRTWLTYAVNVEMFWSRLPFEDRLKQVADAGFSHYEFWPWRTKDIAAIKRVNDQLGLVPVQFTASPKKFSEGITDPARKAEFLDDVKAAIPVAKTLGVKLLTVVAGEETAGYSRAQQMQAVIDAFKAAAPVVEDAGITLILEPLNILVDHPKQ